MTARRTSAPQDSDGRRRRGPIGTGGLEDGHKRKRVLRGAGSPEHEGYKFVVKCSDGESYEVTCDTVGVVGGEDTASQGSKEDFEHGILTRSRAKRMREESKLPDAHLRG